MTKKINDTVETLFREQRQDWGKSPLNTGWAEKPAIFFYSAMESAAVIISSSCIMYRKIMIITAILCV